MKEKIKSIAEASEALKKFNLRSAGAGCENVVFETDASSKKLVKVGAEEFRQQIKKFLEHKDGTDILGAQREKMHEQKRAQREIVETFGKEHVLESGFFKFKVPLKKHEIIEILGEKDGHLADSLDENPEYKIETIIRTQPIAEELKDKEKFKTRDIRVTLITKDNFDSAGTMEGSLEKVRNIMDSYLSRSTEIISNEEYAKIYKEIFSKIIAFTKKTGRMIDIFGPENVTIFTNEKGELDYHLVDPILPGREKYWDVNIKDDKKKEGLRHYYSYYYALKRASEILGLGKNIEPQDLVYFKDLDETLSEIIK